MPTIRLRVDQIEHLRRSDPAKELHLAVSRWRRREIVARFGKKEGKGQFVLQSMSIRHKPENLTDSEIRAILDAHFNHPVNMIEKIKAADLLVESLMPKQDYIVEEW